MKAHAVCFRILGLTAILLWAGCLSMGREGGIRAKAKLTSGMTQGEAVSVLAAKGAIIGTSEFAKQPDGSWQPAHEAPYSSITKFKADQAILALEMRTKEVVRVVMLDRVWGWMGWDVFLLHFDREGRLVGSDMVHLD